MKKKILSTLIFICMSVFAFSMPAGASSFDSSGKNISYLQSKHPYDNNMTYYAYTDNYGKYVTDLKIYFSEETKTENGKDFIYIYNTDKSLIGTYSGTELSGKSISVKGNAAIIKLVSNSSNNAYGFRVEKVEAFNNEEVIAVTGYYDMVSNRECEWKVDSMGSFTCDVMGDYTEGTAPWYEYRDKIKTVNIWNLYSGIGDYAFYGCNNLLSVKLGSASSIGDYAFYGCNNLLSVELGSVSSIGKYAFYNCENLLSVKFDSVCSIDSYAFYGCDNLKDVYYSGENAKWREMTVMDNNTPLIYADKHCMYYVTVVEPYSYDKYILNVESGEKININDLPEIEGCNIQLYDPEFWPKFQFFDLNTPITSNMTLECIYRPLNEKYSYEIVNNEAIITMWDPFAEEIIIPETIEGYPITKIVRNSQNWYAEAQTIIIADSVKEIGEDAFLGLSNLKNVKLPDGITKIGKYAFDGCRSLTEIVIPNQVKTIENNAFYDCEKLNNITLHSNIKFIDDSAFYNCTDLKTIKYIGTEADWDSITIGQNNYCLKNAQVVYMSGTKTTVTADSKSFTVKPINIDNGNTVILALYNGDTFVEMQSKPYTGEDIPFTADKAYTSAKVMVWNDLESMTPICDVEIVKQN